MTNELQDDPHWINVIDPAGGEIVGRVRDLGVPDAVVAVDRAHAAAESWAELSSRARAELLSDMHRLMLRDRDSLADLVCAENGKSRGDALAEIGYAAEFFRWFAEEGVRSGGTYGPSPDGAARTVVTHHPVGVAALVTPWNFPAAMPARKIAPALAAGCTVVMKPPAETPLTALAMMDLLAEAGVPEGVVNIVPTTDAEGVVAAWLDDPRVRKLSFTGSTGVGRILLARAAQRVVNCSMELGGNAPFVVWSDADVDAAVDGAMLAKFRNSGQACTAANRFFVHDDVYDEFVEKLAARVQGLSVGPASEGCDIGPLISQRAVDTLEMVVERARQQGAREFVRVPVSHATGYFFPPVVLVDVPPDAEILEQELFGPVVPLLRWSEEKELLSLVNGSELGLAAYLYTGSASTALRVAERMEAGMVAVNRGLVSDPSTPFGGVKQSGLGREGARHGLEEFLETQYLSLNIDE